MTVVLVIAETPEHDFTQNPGQPSSTMKAYRVEAPEGETVAQAMERVLGDGEIGPFGLGTTFFAYDEAAAEKRVLESQLAQPQ